MEARVPLVMSRYAGAPIGTTQTSFLLTNSCIPRLDMVSESSNGFCLIDCGMEFAQLTDKIHQWVTSIGAARAGKQP